MSVERLNEPLRSRNTKCYLKVCQLSLIQYNRPQKLLYSPHLAPFNATILEFHLSGCVTCLNRDKKSATWGTWRTCLVTRQTRKDTSEVIDYIT